jgi:hypothetical protein
MAEHIAETEKNVTNITVIQKPSTKNTVNGLLITAAVIIFIAVALSYFVNLNIFTNISLKELSTRAIWVFIGCFSISSIFKRVAINRAKNTEEYKKQKEETDKTLKEKGESGALIYADEYCRWYEKNQLNNARYRLLYPVGLTLSVFDEKYKAKSFKWVLKCKELSFKQKIAVIKANLQKIEYYNADFLRTTVFVQNKKSPSAMFNSDSKNFWYTLRKFVVGFLGSVFVVSITKDLIFSFSMAVFVEACIQTTIIVASSAFSTSFGWGLIMNTEINRMQLQEKEVLACEKWTNENYPKD